MTGHRSARPSSRSSVRPRPASPTWPSSSPAPRRRGRQRRRDAALPRHGHRHGQAAARRAARRPAPPARRPRRDRRRPASRRTRPRARADIDGDPRPRAGAACWSAAPGSTCGRRWTGCEIPPTDPTVRARLEARAAELGAGGAARASSRELDPVAAAGDPAHQRPADRPGAGGRRADRAAVQRDAARHRVYVAPTVQLGLRLARDAARRSASTRGSSGCGSAGCVDEVRGLAARGLRDGRTASRAVGYAQVLAALDGELDRDRGAGARPRRRPAGWSAARSRGSAATPRISWLDAADAPTWSTGRSRRSRGGRRVRRRMMGTWLTADASPRATAPRTTSCSCPTSTGSLDARRPRRSRRLADRHAGIGGDGVIRVVPHRARRREAVAGQADGAEWFMDYRNADGALAEMCGNGVRVFAAYLRREGAGRAAGSDRSPSPPAPACSRRSGSIDDGYRGRPRSVAARRRARCATRRLRRHGAPRPACRSRRCRIDLGNPHVVVALPDEHRARGRRPRHRAPLVDPEPPHGTNVELVRAARGPGHIRMRVHERGVGETRSCGTGAAAAALATRLWAGAARPDVWRVEVPGGVARP